MNILEPEVSPLPANVAAERSVLGAILMNPKAMTKRRRWVSSQMISPSTATAESIGEWKNWPTKAP